MGGLILLAEARAAGLTVTAEGDLLRVRGPRRAESIAKQLLARKDEILPLVGENTDPIVRRVVDAVRAGETFVLRPRDADESSPDIPRGWTRASWINRLHQMATATEPYKPARAVELRAMAARLSKPTGAKIEGGAA